VCRRALAAPAFRIYLLLVASACDDDAPCSGTRAPLSRTSVWPVCPGRDLTVLGPQGSQHPGAQGGWTNITNADQADP